MMRVEAAQESAAARRAERRQELVGRLRQALEPLDDQLLQLLDQDHDLLAEALAPMLAARGERRSILRSGQEAREMLPVLERELKHYEAELEALRGADPDDGAARQRREAAWSEAEGRRQAIAMREEDLRRAEALAKGRR
jgi:hypothetical protein